MLNLVFINFTLLLTPCIFIKYLIKMHGASNNVKFTKTKFNTIEPGKWNRNFPPRNVKTRCLATLRVYLVTWL